MKIIYFILAIFGYIAAILLAKLAYSSYNNISCYDIPCLTHFEGSLKTFIIIIILGGVVNAFFALKKNKPIQIIYEVISVFIFCLFLFSFKFFKV